MAKKGELNIDIDWYVTQQLIPPITRLIVPVFSADENGAVYTKSILENNF